MKQENLALLKQLGLAGSEDHLSHAYLLVHDDLDQLKEVSLGLAEWILNGFEDSGKESPLADGHEDLLLIDEDKIPIATIRQATNRMFSKPLVAKHKVILIHNAGLMRQEAQNALLKSLEEPPAYVVWILTANNVSKLLPTIQSRCQIKRLPRADREQAIDSLLLASVARLMEAGFSGDVLEIMSERSFYDQLKDTKSQVMSLITDYLYGFMRYITKVEERNNSFYTSYQKIKHRVTTEQILSSLQKAEEIRQLFDVNINTPLALETLFLSMGPRRNE